MRVLVQILYFFSISAPYDTKCSLSFISLQVTEYANMAASDIVPYADRNESNPYALYLACDQDVKKPEVEASSSTWLRAFVGTDTVVLSTR